MDVQITVYVEGLAGLLMGLLENLKHGEQQRLAQAAGISRNTVSRLANGHSDVIRLETLQAISAAAEWTLGDLVIPPGVVGFMSKGQLQTSVAINNLLAVDSEVEEIAIIPWGNSQQKNRPK